jgi:thiamine phosphate synthase YjbQ (UPF0047 family)
MHFRPAQPDDTPALKALTVGTGVLKPQEVEVLQEVLGDDRDADSQHVAVVAEDNADAHLKGQVMGREVVVAVTKGKLDFGPWGQAFQVEFDSRRPKRVLIKVIGE